MANIKSMPRSVYIHIPFCRHRCGYCNFSLVADRDYLVDRFLDALETEIRWLTGRCEVETLFLGGGTPSHLSPTNLQRLRAIIDSRFTIVEDAEVTAECNPNDLDEEKSSALADFGVNRISMGVQSLNAEKLKRLERDHNVDEVQTAIKHARMFASSVSIDLIFAAPDETLAEWTTDLQAALQLNPDHVSTYELTYEKGTQFWNRQSRGELIVSDDDIRADMYIAANEMLVAAGVEPYEVSSFAKSNHQCRHNLIYWSGDPYFAFGPGASRYIDGVRQTNHQSTLQYLKLIEAGVAAVAFAEELSPENSARELLAIGLRRIAGVEEAAFLNRTGFAVADLLSEVQTLWLNENLIKHTDGNWRLTFRGRMLCDQLAGQIVGG